MLKHTSLYHEHLKLKAKMVPFGGWEMPIQYTSQIEEHLNCRKNVGIFDISHMGNFLIEGESASVFVDLLMTNAVTTAKDRKAIYTLMCNPIGGIIDDLIIYKFNSKKFFLIVNASNIEKDFFHIKSTLEHFSQKSGVQFVNLSDEYSQIAIQGPKALSLVESAFGVKTEKIEKFSFEILNESKPSEIILAKTGYTGEDGFEAYFRNSQAESIWTQLLKTGEEYHMLPCGLGARDTLRLEMAYPLYGNDISLDSNPIEAGLKWATKNQTNYIGSDIIKKITSDSLSKKLVGFLLKDRNIPRNGNEIYKNEHSKPIGQVTSGSYSPTLKQSIGLGYVSTLESKLGNTIKIKIRENYHDAEIVKTPFIKKGD